MSMVRANGVDLHVEEVAAAGAQRGTAVLIHGMTSDSLASWYITLAAPLAQAGLRVLLFDLRGHGHSACPPTGYALNDFTADLHALIEDVWQVDGAVHLFGNSFGGTVAFTYAAQHPGKVAGLVTIESGPPTAAWFARMTRSLARAAETLANADAVVNSLPLFARRVRAMSMLLASTDIGLELPQSVLPTVSALAAIDCPVLCLYGARSAVKDLIPETERLLPQSRHVVVDGQKHTLLIDAPEQVQAQILPWLSAPVS
jgi:pimeloyl-ACP methyl ester carboxylesterase